MTSGRWGEGNGTGGSLGLARERTEWRLLVPEDPFCPYDGQRLKLVCKGHCVPSGRGCEESARVHFSETTVSSLIWILIIFPFPGFPASISSGAGELFGARPVYLELTRHSQGEALVSRWTGPGRGLGCDLAYF